MHHRGFSDGSTNVSNSYAPSWPMPNRFYPEKFEPVTVNPEKFRPRPPGMSDPHQFRSLPWETAHAPIPEDSTDTATQLPPMWSPPSITQQSPIRDSSPGPRTRNKLRSPRSISALPNGRNLHSRSSSSLATFQSNLALNNHASEPPQPRPEFPSAILTSTPNTSGLRSERAPSRLSISNTAPTNPPHKTGKPGFFSKLFGFGKSKPKDSIIPMSGQRLRNPAETPRPMSVLSYNSTTASTSTRYRAVLVKKPPAIDPTKYSHHPSVLTRPVKPESFPEPTLPQVGSTMVNPTPERATTTVHATNHTTFSNNPNETNHMLHTITANTSPRPPGPALGSVSQPYGTYRVQGFATKEYAPYPGTGNNFNQYPNYANGSTSLAKGSGYPPLAITSGPILCSVCNINPKYINQATGETSPYCSDACRTAATATTPQPQQATCSYPGCTSPGVMHPADHHWNYCSESHERSARKGCIRCRQSDYSGIQPCKRCKEALRQHTPLIVPVPMDHDTFWEVVDKCSESWDNPAQCPIFQAARIYKIALTQDRRDTYLGYRDTLEHYGRFTMKGRPTGNERVLWYGARRACNLGEPGQTTPCLIPRCSLCSIVRGSSDKGDFATSASTGRFGAGIYAFTKALKASDHASNEKNIESSWVALLLCKVATGHECVMRHDNTTLTAPPQGYDSVIGEVRGRLNYDELVVYTKDAIRPAWLVMYQRT